VSIFFIQTVEAQKNFRGEIGFPVVFIFISDMIVGTDGVVFLRCRGISGSMNKIVSLESIRNKKAAERGFRRWHRKFKDLGLLDENTRWSDFPDEVLFFLAEDESGSRQFLYDLLMGVLDLGNGFEFESLPSEKLLPLLDIYFLLIDQVRFECMRRLGWIEEIPFGDQALIFLIRNFGQGNFNTLATPPKLSKSHPAYPEYARLSELDQGVFVRKTIPDAVQAFKNRIGDSNPAV
jgi:hypothetical protein